MAIKKRVVRAKRNIRIAGQETQGERQARTAVRFIMDNPYYKFILQAIREGTPNSRIAEVGIQRGWFEVNQKTVVTYLQYFRKKQPGLCRPQPHLESENAPMGFSDLFDGNMSIVDEEVELVRLIKLQQARLGIAFRNEREIGVLLSSNRREVSELRELIMELARLRGLSSSSNVNVNMLGYTQSVKEDLKGIQQDEQNRNMIATLVHELVGVSSGN